MSLNVGYVGWLGHGNLGDEAAFEAFRRHMRRAGKPHNIEPFESGSRYDLVVIGGGTLLSPFGRRRDVLGMWLRKNGIPYVILGTGIEQLDLPSVADWPDIKRDEKWRAVLAENLGGAEAVFVRDVISQEVAGKMVAVMPPVIGDLCYLSTDAEVTLAPSKLLPWRGIAVNIGTSFGNIYGRDEERLITETSNAVSTILGWGLDVTLFPVWGNDILTQSRVAAKCAGTGFLHELPLFSDYRVLSAYLRDFDLVIGMKLHSLVFAATVETPMVAIAYREKCTAMMRTIGLERFSFETDTAALGSNLVEAAREALARRREISEHIHGRRSKLALDADLAIRSIF